MIIRSKLFKAILRRELKAHRESGAVETQFSLGTVSGVQVQLTLQSGVEDFHDEYPETLCVEPSE